MSDRKEAKDRAHWEAVEEAAGLLEEHDIERALLAIRAVLLKDVENPYAFDLLGNALFEARKFAEDLYYRLHVVPIYLPALRARIADIVPLAEHFLQVTGRGKHLSSDAAAVLIRHHWPGNVRELRNAMERAAVLVRGNSVTSADLDFLNDRPGEDASIEWPDEDLPSAIARLETLLISRALAQSISCACSGWNSR